MNVRGVVHAWLAVGLALVLVACGGGDSGTTDATTSTPPAPTGASGVTASSSAAGSPSDSPSAEPPATSGSVKASAQRVPRTYDDALAHFDALGSEPVSFRRFVSPSNNIYCTLNVRHLSRGCEIADGGVTDPNVCDQAQASTVVGRVEFRHGRAVPICNTDTIRTPGAPTLPYGEAARFGRVPIQCLSEKIGVTCISLSQTEGFFIHRGEYVIFNAG